ncbi:MAG: alpha/beta hydrolase [Acidobacteria bacterium]|nr:alpha/beta hydrolase [Acidobacteriota bacterium]
MLSGEYVEINGLKIHYVKSGTEGKTILFLHGFPEFWYMWHRQLEEFGRDHTAIAMDMRGFNLSDKPPNVDDYKTSHLVSDIKAMLERFSPGRKAILVAHDWGGAVAWAFALTHPELLEKLIIINSPHPAVFLRELKNNPEQQKASAYMLMFRKPEAEALLSANNYAGLAKAVFDSSTRPEAYTDDDRRAYLAAWAQPGALTGGLNYYRASKIGPPSPVDPQLGAVTFADASSFVVKVPTLVVWGEKDRALLTGCLDGLEQFVPDLTLKRIPDGSHWVVHEKPELVNNYIRQFIEGN